MLEVVKEWGRRYLSDPQAVLLMVLLFSITFLIVYMGGILAPVITSIVIAYLLKWFANVLVNWRIRPGWAVWISYSTFLGLFLSAILILWPIIWQQLLRLYAELPTMITAVQSFLYLLPDKFPQFLSKEMVEGWAIDSQLQLKHATKILFTVSLASLPTLIALVVYLVLVPLMVFFFLKDNQVIVSWLSNFLPDKKPLLAKVWREINEQIGNYIRGKVAEIMIVGMVSALVFYGFGVRYAVLLSVLVGLSVVIPYVGAVVVTFPVILIAFFQWGAGSQLAYFILAYGLIQMLDGNVLVPLLFSEAVNIHPVAIIVAILVFGSWWGFWGVFFAIPLATVVKAVIDAWPRHEIKP